MAFDRLRGDTFNSARGKIVFLDTSAILMLFEFSINLEDELNRLVGKHQIFIPRSIKDELLQLSSKGNGGKRNKAKASLKLIEKYEIFDDNTTLDGDNALVKICKNLDCIVLTNDKELRRRLKKIGCKIIFLRGKNRLEME